MAKITIVSGCIFLQVLLIGVTGLSEKQMAAAVKMVRNVCLPKSKASSDDIDKMHKGDWNIDHTAKCYMYCALATYKLINKDNTLNYEGAQVQLKQLPDTFRPSATECVEQCKGAVVTTDDQCEAAYEISRCFYSCNPEKYFLP